MFQKVWSNFCCAERDDRIHLSPSSLPRQPVALQILEFVGLRDKLSHSFSFACTLVDMNLLEVVTSIHRYIYFDRPYPYRVSTRPYSNVSTPTPAFTLHFLLVLALEIAKCTYSNCITCV